MFPPVLQSYSLLLSHICIIKDTNCHQKGERVSQHGREEERGKTTLLYLVQILKNILLRLISDIHLRI